MKPLLLRSSLISDANDDQEVGKLLLSLLSERSNVLKDVRESPHWAGREAERLLR